MLKERFYKIMDRDELILHKLGFVLGTILGAVTGLFVSDKASQYQEIIEEATEDVAATGLE